MPIDVDHDGEPFEGRTLFNNHDANLQFPATTEVGYRGWLDVFSHPIAGATPGFAR
ncbi:MAG: hypothetical protein WBP81_28175 [Solirubrobacteraceae bacterium]